ncbi:MAG: STAS-like domain-containing protein [Candidatus Binataceae bacterium]|nr:STAS-like domain-containing protein [Candidatus Binataceae bacterium]
MNENIERKDLRQWIIQAVASGKDKHITSEAVQRFSISRQAVNREIRLMVRDGILLPTGNTRARQYRLATIAEVRHDFPMTPDLAEDTVWRLNVAAIVADLPPNIQLICQYGFTEMFNNVLDHSGSSIARIFAHRTAARVEISVNDLGIGIFNKIQQERRLDDPRHAILELSKGKLTTDPERHTGEGVFFTSRMFDHFMILSGNLSFVCSPEAGDWLLDLADWGVEVKETGNEVIGTTVLMRISCFSERTTKQVMDMFAGEDQDFTFSRTHVPVRLARYGSEQLVSRSQAKRLLTRVNQFKEVLLDFEGVETIGQAFADEVFRVFQNEHRSINLKVVRANDEVSAMITHVLAVNHPYLPGMEPRSDPEKQ